MTLLKGVKLHLGPGFKDWLREFPDEGTGGGGGQEKNKNKKHKETTNEVTQQCHMCGVTPLY